MGAEMPNISWQGPENEKRPPVTREELENQYYNSLSAIWEEAKVSQDAAILKGRNFKVTSEKPAGIEDSEEPIELDEEATYKEDPRKNYDKLDDSRKKIVDAKIKKFGDFNQFLSNKGWETKDIQKLRELVMMKESQSELTDQEETKQKIEQWRKERKN